MGHGHHNEWVYMFCSVRIVGTRLYVIPCLIHIHMSGSQERKMVAVVVVAGYPILTYEPFYILGTGVSDAHHHLKLRPFSAEYDFCLGHDKK